MRVRGPREAGEGQRAGLGFPAVLMGGEKTSLSLFLEFFRPDFLFSPLPSASFLRSEKQM